MAAALRIGTLTDELIAIIANIQDKSSPRFKHLKTVAQNIVKRNAAGRVDQFEVSRRLDGLQEKFQIVGNAGLADAVRLRLSELDARKCHWAPEVLFLLLELSDKPASKSGPDRVELFKPPDPPPILVWSDLGTSDLDKEDIWDDIDYANDSSDDNLSLASSDISIPRIIPQSSKVPLDECIPPEDIYLTVEDDGLVSSIQNTQAWRYLPSSLPESSNGILTDLQVMREVIFMLEGLPNSLFRNLNDSIEIDDRFFVQHASREAFRSILRSFSDLGVCIQRLRAFGKQPQEVPFMQMFQKEVDKLVYDLDSFLSETEARYSVKPQLPCASLLELFDDVRKETKLLVELASLVKRLKETTGQSGFLCLDLLYDLVCAKQAAADDAEYKVMAKIFFKCFEIYAKPIQLWMKTGIFAERNTSLKSSAPINQDIFGMILTLKMTFSHSPSDTIYSEMVKSMAEAKDVDGMISVHQSFISSMEEQCLLSKTLAPIYQAVISILDLCLQFSDIQVGRYAEYQYDQANQSTTYLHLNSSRYRRGRRSASEEDDEELSSDEDEGDYINQTMFGDGSSTCMSFAELSYRERLLGVKQKSDELSRFVKTGLRGIGRVDGRNSWAMLADRLEPKSHTFM
ncbi:hypothetical protein CISG_03440 [Coccidioides immitis RMSCC 3703]|uniref:Spindle pole body component n=1 Tax=Coccidioides immitis RMSCC 3703 TaxID=454286 RepID=A0A0J8QLB8_COCIT|nr:hypothetical protein CISG_03440 [Coccidioides immitis RMSCC 3703]